MKSKSILLIVNPVSGRMKSKNGLFEMLDELYRFDPHNADDDIPMLPLSDDSASDPQEELSQDDMQPTFGHVTPDTLGGEPDPDRHVTVVTTMYRGHASQLAASAAAGGFDTVVCCGGDGTLNETVAGLLSIPIEQRPALGYIPAGSTNDFACSLGLPTTLRGAARVAVSSYEMPLDLGRFTPGEDHELPERSFTYIASFGIFTSASYSTSQKAKNRMGHLAYLLTGVKDLTHIPSHHVALDLNGRHIEGEYAFGAVTNTTSAAGIFKFPPDQVSMSDGELEVFLVHKPKNPSEFKTIASAIMSGNFDSCPLIEFVHTKEVTFTLEKPLSWSLDGEEAIGGTTVTIRCLPSAVQFKKRM